MTGFLPSMPDPDGWTLAFKGRPSSHEGENRAPTEQDLEEAIRKVVVG